MEQRSFSFLEGENKSVEISDLFALRNSKFIFPATKLENSLKKGKFQMRFPPLAVVQEKKSQETAVFFSFKFGEKNDRFRRGSLRDGYYFQGIQ